MTNLIRIGLALRLASLMALPAAILTSVVLERSPVIIFLLAFALALVRPVVLRAVKSSPPAWPSVNVLAVKFLGMSLLGGILFVAFAGLGALFTEIDLQNRLTGTDVAIILGWTAFAAICLAIPVKMLDGVVGATSSHVRVGPFGISPDGTGPDGGGEIIEGEVIRSDRTGPDKR